MKRMIESRLVMGLVAIAITLVPFFGANIAGAYQFTSTLDGLPVNVEANFVFDYSGDLVTVTIDNLVVNPTSIIQNLSGLGFALNIVESPIPVLSSSSAMFRDVAVGGSYTGSGPAATGWALDSGVVFPFGSGYLLHSLPSNTLIGQPDASNLYSNANGSIAGNGPHNPFIYGPAEFVIDFGAGGYDLVPGMNVSGVAWNFGTEPRTVVPEPATMLLLGSGLVGLVGLRRKFRKS